MGIMQQIRNFTARIKRQIEELFGVRVAETEDTDILLNRYDKITHGIPPWCEEDEDLRSLNFAAFIDDFLAGLVCLEINVSITGGARAEWLQKQIDYTLQKMRVRVSDALGSAGIIFKPNGMSERGVDFVRPDSFVVVDQDSNGNIMGCIFRYTRQQKNKFYSRFEYHRFESDGLGGKIYRISNLAFKSTSSHSIGDQCELSEVQDWATLEPEIYVTNVDKPLFAYFGNPAPNRADSSSPLSTPVWASALVELRDLDIAWSLKGDEVEDSRHVTYIPDTAVRYAEDNGVKLPRYIRALQMGGQEDSIHEHVATLLTDQRIDDINSILAMISTKLGLSQGTFRLDERTGMITATQVEADDQDTIRTVKNLREALQNAMDDLIYALDKIADGYSNTRPEAYEVEYKFGDITYNYEEDRQHHYALALQGKYPWVDYYVKYLGESREEAERMLAEAAAANTAPTSWMSEE